MLPLGIGHSVLRGAQTEGQLRAEDGPEPVGFGGLGQSDHSVEAVVVRDGQGMQAQLHGFFDEFLRRGGSIQKAVVGMHMELGVGDGGQGPGRPLAASAPRGARLRRRALAFVFAFAGALRVRAER